MKPYERSKVNDSCDGTVSAKQQAWLNVIAADVETGLNQGKGYELSHIRDSMNKQLETGQAITNM